MLIRKTVRWADEHPVRAGTLAGWLQQATGVLNAVLLIPLAHAQLGNEHSGIWFALQGIVVLVAMCDFGVGFALTRQIAHSTGGGGHESEELFQTAPGWLGISELISAAAIIYRKISVVAVLLAIVIFEFILPFTRLFGSQSVGNYRGAWYLLIGSTLLLLASKKHLALLEGTGRIYAMRLIMTVYQISVTSLLVGALSLGYQSTAMASGQLLAACGCYYLSRLWARRIANGRLNVQPAANHDANQNALRLWKVARRIGIVNFSGYIVSVAQAPLLGALLGPSLVTPYYFVQKVGQMLNIAVLQMTFPVLPIFTSRLAQGRREEARDLMRATVIRHYGATLLANAAFFIGLLFLASWWMEASLIVDRPTLAVMAIDYCLLGFSMVWSHLVLASGRNPFIPTTIIAAILVLILNLFLVKPLGTLGVALSSLVAGIATNYWFSIVQGIRLTRILNPPPTGATS